MTAQQLTPEVLAQLNAYVQSGDAASYYNTLAQYGHDYGNLAYQAATDTGFAGIYANNFLANKAAEYGVSLDRNYIMQRLMEEDFSARSNPELNGWPITADVIATYHKEVFRVNGLPEAAWTGSFLDSRLGPAAWCLTCNNWEVQGATLPNDLFNLVKNLAKDWNGTASELSSFINDTFTDGVLSETLADMSLQNGWGIDEAGIIKAVTQTAGIIAEAILRMPFTVLEGWGYIFGSVSSLFTSSQTWVLRRDPLTLDLDADGLETVALNTTNPIYFDHDGDGNAAATGWISPDDGFLALDRNGNGTINSGRELFGDATPLSGGGTAADGFAALAQEDTNGDGVVNNSDTNFANLRLWQDLNQNGLSESNELFTLTQKGIASINVTQTENNTLLPNGNVIADLGTYTKTDGSTGTLGDTAQLGDIDLREDTFLSQFTDTIPLTPEAQALPGMQGSGQVREWKEAA